MQTVERIYRRALLWARLVERGYAEPLRGTWDEPETSEWFASEFGLDEELEPDERRLLLAAPGELADWELNSATWYCEPLSMLVWALGLDGEPLYDSDVAPFSVAGRMPIRHL